MARSRTNIFREGVTVLALLLAIGVCALAVWRYARVRAELRVAGEPSLRTLIRDRLLGKEVDLRGLGVARPSPESVDGQPVLLWILDLERCSRCVGAIAEWTQLERQLPDHVFALLVIGDPSPPLAALLRAPRRTVIVDTDRSSVFASLGPLLPSTKVLLDPSGIVVMVDSRASARDCGWSFEAQVGALLGVSSARTIRTVGLPAL